MIPSRDDFPNDFPDTTVKRGHLGYDLPDTTVKRGHLNEEGPGGNGVLGVPESPGGNGVLGVPESQDHFVDITAVLFPGYKFSLRGFI